MLTPVNSDVGRQAEQAFVNPDTWREFVRKRILNERGYEPTREEHDAAEERRREFLKELIGLDRGRV